MPNEPLFDPADVQTVRRFAWWSLAAVVGATAWLILLLVVAAVLKGAWS